MSLEMIGAYRDALTKRQLEALRLMAHPVEDGDGFFVYERGTAYVDWERFGSRTFFALVRACVLSCVDGEPGEFEIYEINSDGRRLLDNLADRPPSH